MRAHRLLLCQCSQSIETNGNNGMSCPFLSLQRQGTVDAKVPEHTALRDCSMLGWCCCSDLLQQCMNSRHQANEVFPRLFARRKAYWLFRWCPDLRVGEGAGEGQPSKIKASVQCAMTQKNWSKAHLPTLGAARRCGWLVLPPTERNPFRRGVLAAALKLSN